MPACTSRAEYSFFFIGFKVILLIGFRLHIGTKAKMWAESVAAAEPESKHPRHIDDGGKAEWRSSHPWAVGGHRSDDDDHGSAAAPRRRARRSLLPTPAAEPRGVPLRLPGLARRRRLLEPAAARGSPPTNTTRTRPGGGHLDVSTSQSFLLGFFYR
jgi:hypothetical protein